MFATGFLVAYLFIKPELVTFSRAPSEFEDFDAIWGLVVNNFIKEISDTPENKKDCFLKTLQGGLPLCLNDKYAGYLSPSSYDEKTFARDEKYIGIGIEVATIKNNNVVISLLTNSSAIESGKLERGDIIARVDGEDVEKKPLDFIVSKLRGAESTNVSIQVRRDGVIQDVVTLIRKPIVNRSVESEMLGGDIGYVKILKFNEETTDEFLEDALRLYREISRRNTINKLILDLRDNPGGTLNSVLGISMFFANSNDDFIVSLIGRAEKLKVITVGDMLNEGLYPSLAFTGVLNESQVVVLVNAESASSAEILAGLLRDWFGALLVGEKTYGKGLVQTVHRLPSGGAIILTTDEYFVGNSKVKINETGLKPDYAVTDSRKSLSDILLLTSSKLDVKNDEQLKKAIALLSTN